MKSILLALFCLTLTLVAYSQAQSSSALAPAASNRVLSRHRRFLIPSSSGWTFTTAFTLKIPIEDVGSTLSIAVPFTYSFDDSTVSGRRSFSSHEEARENTFRTIEGYIEKLPGFSSGGIFDLGGNSGLDPHACLLRTICEAAAVPLHYDGFVGQMLNSMLLPSNHLEAIPYEEGESDYLTAQRNGQFRADCSMYYAQCHTSFFTIDEFEEASANSIDGLYQYVNSYANQTSADQIHV